MQNGLTLVVLAAGMGSRYGGLKQIEPVGPSGEIVLDYSVHDALRAGFNRMVFVIRPDLEAPFRQAIGTRTERLVDTAYVFQTADAIPPGFAVPTARSKPWGTGHALLVAEQAVPGPFAVINADDYYGVQGYALLAEFLRGRPNNDRAWSMIAFRLRNTLSEHGAVSRGVCTMDSEGMLSGIEEVTDIKPDGQGGGVQRGPTSNRAIPGDALVSMNLWGFTPAVFGELHTQFAGFLTTRGTDPKAEFFLPSAVDGAIAGGRATVRVLPTADAWCGVTFPPDKPVVMAAIRALVQAGIYPESLHG